MGQTKILITGAAGKMGHAVAAAAEGRDDCTIIAGVDLNTAQYGSFPIYKTFAECPEKPDVIIDFSNPALLDDLLNYCLVNGIPAVLATTGYNEAQIAQIKKAAEQIPVEAERLLKPFGVVRLQGYMVDPAEEGLSAHACPLR